MENLDLSAETLETRANASDPDISVLQRHDDGKKHKLYTLAKRCRVQMVNIAFLRSMDMVNSD